MNQREGEWGNRVKHRSQSGVENTNIVGQKRRCGGPVWKHTNGCAGIHQVSLASRRIRKVNKAAEGVDLPAAAI